MRNTTTKQRNRAARVNQYSHVNDDDDEDVAFCLSLCACMCRPPPSSIPGKKNKIINHVI